MADIYLRGVEPLTFYRGANGAAGGHLYRGSAIQADLVDRQDAERLIREGFIEKVVRSGEDFVLYQDTPTGSEGDTVRIGDLSVPPATEYDHGTFNSDAQAAATAAAEGTDTAEDLKRSAAREKLASLGGEPDGRSSQAVWVEYVVGRGQRYEDVKDTSKAELQKLVEQQQS